MGAGEAETQLSLPFSRPASIAIAKVVVADTAKVVIAADTVLADQAA
jgi:hypothetical protein